MKTKTYTTTSDNENQVENSANEQKMMKYRLWLKKVQELNEKNRAYYLRIHPVCEVLCA